MKDDIVAKVLDVRKRIQDRIGHRKISVAVTLGSGHGLTEYGKEFDDLIEIKYEEVGLPECTMPGHAGVLRVAKIDGHYAAIFDGRKHLYEGVSPHEVVMGVRAAAFLGAKTQILTCACGSLREDNGLSPGNIVPLRDHINKTGENPLIGLKDDFFGPRFLEMSDVYDKDLRLLAKEVLSELKAKDQKENDVRIAVMVGVKGPCYETFSEACLFREAGAEVIGMASIMEAIALHQMGVKILSLALITNFSQNIEGESLLSQKRQTTARINAEPVFKDLLTQIIGRL